MLTEVYGYDRARRTIWIGFLAAFLLASTIALVGLLPGEAEWSARVGQQAYDNVLSATPRIVLASLIAYLAGSFSNAYLLARMKILTRGRWLWTRTIGSTIVGQGVDTVLFVLIAFAFAEGFSLALLWSIIVSNYVFKVGIEVLLTPATYAVTGHLKRTENAALPHFVWRTHERIQTAIIQQSGYIALQRGKGLDRWSPHPEQA